MPPSRRNKEPELQIGREIRPGEEIVLYIKKGPFSRRVRHEIRAKVVDGKTVYVKNIRYGEPKIRTGDVYKTHTRPSDSEMKDRFEAMKMVTGEDVWVEQTDGYIYGLAYFSDEFFSVPEITNRIETLA